MPRKTKTRSKAKVKPHAVTKKMGRKLTLTPEVQAEIEQILKEGHYQKIAYELVGIPHRTYYQWITWGEEAEEKQNNGEKLTTTEETYMHFMHTVKKAIVWGLRRDVNRIDISGEKDWKAIAWKLERMHPDMFALQGRVTVDQNINHNVNINHDIKVELSNANAGTVLDIMAECGAIPPPARGTKRETEVE